jgi:hypothetical protein
LVGCLSLKMIFQVRFFFLFRICICKKAYCGHRLRLSSYLLGLVVVDYFWTCCCCCCWLFLLSIIFELEVVVDYLWTLGLSEFFSSRDSFRHFEVEIISLWRVLITICRSVKRRFIAKNTLLFLQGSCFPSRILIPRSALGHFSPTFETSSRTKLTLNPRPQVWVYLATSKSKEHSGGSTTTALVGFTNLCRTHCRTHIV